MQRLLVPPMIFLSGAFMAVAWLGHLRWKQHGFWLALALSWTVVLPEYVLNVAATRFGHGAFSGAQMAAIHLASGVVCVTLVSRFFLGEMLSRVQLTGLGVLALGIALVLTPR
jgi:uncharacterized protein (DUF486 family)